MRTAEYDRTFRYGGFGVGLISGGSAHCRAVAEKWAPMIMPDLISAHLPLFKFLPLQGSSFRFGFC